MRTPDSNTWRASLDEDVTSAMHFFDVGGRWCALQGSRLHNPTSCTDCTVCSEAQLLGIYAKHIHPNFMKPYKSHPCSVIKPQILWPVYPKTSEPHQEHTHCSTQFTELHDFNQISTPNFPHWSADKSYGRQIVRTLDKPYGDKLYGLISLGQTVRKTNRTDCLD